MSVPLQPSQPGPLSQVAFEKAQALIPGGVNSPVRAFRAMGGNPRFIQRGQGAYLYDVDDRPILDFIMSWGATLLGHAHPEIVEAVSKAAQDGLSFGAPTQRETFLAAQIQEAFPSMEKIRLVSSGTEACMTAIRLARAWTRRTGLVKFTGHYHGHADALLVKGGSGLATFGIPTSLGVPEEVVRETRTCPFNDVDTLAEILEARQSSCLILEPIGGNCGFIRPKPGFLKAVHRLCQQTGTVLIFDEVMTGFRVSFGGVQALEGVQPDMTTLAKVIGAGLPMAAFGGRKEIMDQLAPLGGVYQAGTLSGNPLATAAGSKALEILRREPPYAYLHELQRHLLRGLQEEAQRAGVPFQGDGEGGMFGFFFSPQPVSSFEQAHGEAQHQERFQAFFQGMLQRGIMLPPSAFEACFLSTSHTLEDVEKVVAAAREVFASWTP